MLSPFLSHRSSFRIAVKMWPDFLNILVAGSLYCYCGNRQRRHCSNRFASGLNFAPDDKSHPVWETEKQASAVLWCRTRSWSSQVPWCVTSDCQERDRDRGPRSKARQHPHQWRTGCYLVFPSCVMTNTRWIQAWKTWAAIDYISFSYWCNSLRRTADAGRRWNQDDRGHRPMSHPHRDDHVVHVPIFIHSFIPEVSITSLQVHYLYYSKALPTWYCVGVRPHTPKRYMKVY